MLAKKDWRALIRVQDNGSEEKNESIGKPLGRVTKRGAWWVYD